MDPQEVRRNRGVSPRDAIVSEVETRETDMTMLRFNLQGYILHIAEIITLRRGMQEKPLLVCLIDLCLIKAENVRQFARKTIEGRSVVGSK